MKEIAITFVRSEKITRNSPGIARQRQPRQPLEATKSQGLRLRSAVCFSQQRYKSPYRVVKPRRAVNVKFVKAFTQRRWIPDGSHRRLLKEGSKEGRERGNVTPFVVACRGTFSRRRVSYLSYILNLSFSFSFHPFPPLSLTQRRILIAIFYEQRRGAAHETTAVI